MACEDVCGMKGSRRNKGDMWWWNEEVMEAISRNKDAHKAICGYQTAENMKKYKSTKKKICLKIIEGEG